MRSKIIRKEISLFIILLAFLFAGCEEYLKEENPSEVTTDFLYTTADGLQAAVNGLYSIERSQVSESECNYFALIMGDGGTDIDFDRASEQDMARYMPIDLTIKASVRSWWQKWYRIIERSNSIITFGEQADIPESQKMGILREAYVYRAYAYFWLVRKFDNIWLNTEPTTYQNLDGRTFGVANQADVYALIISDLDKAIQYYGTDWTVVQGRFNQGVARLLRADVALWQKDYQTAQTQAVKIIDQGIFSLEVPENVFTKDNRRNNTKESMYVMQFDQFAAGGGPYHRLSLIFTSQYRLVPGCIVAKEFGGYGWARIHPNPYLLSLYDSKNDKRWNAWWQHNYTYNDPVYDFSKFKYHFGDTIKLNDNSQLQGDNYYKNATVSCKKYWDWVKEPLVTQPYNNVYMFRYPHVFLIASEAYMRLGDNTKALYYINKIRENRILATAPNRLLTSINEDILLDEYARELAFEGQRWFLLKRVGKLVARVQLYGGMSEFRTVKAPNALYYSARTNIKDYHVRWPIPQLERDAMGGFPQNTGYNQ